MRYFLIGFIFFSLSASAGDSSKLYNPSANVQAAITRAKKEKKHVLLQVGSNWCVLCYKFNSFVQLDIMLKRLINDNYIVYHLNYSKENKNLQYLKKLGYPQRFGLPVFVILDSSGNKIHIQDSALLAKGNGYDKEKVKSFLQNWAPGSMEEVLYLQ